MRCAKVRFRNRTASRLDAGHRYVPTNARPIVNSGTPYLHFVLTALMVNLRGMERGLSRGCYEVVSGKLMSLADMRMAKAT